MLAVFTLPPGFEYSRPSMLFDSRFCWWILSFCDPSYMSSFICSRFFLPQSLHATNARPPNRSAPPIPPTTPPMMDLLLVDKLLPLPPPLASDGAMVAVAKPVVLAKTFSVV